MKNVMNFINIFQNYKIFNKLNVDSMCFLGEEESHMMRENISYIRCIFLLFYLKEW